ncbi:MAG: hypothetical protein EA408_03310 [Marinilabiliales bacterium]|nr:MAG: hypothetical protein EA408_03310 [Marinilabiliales bacterium]
MNLNGNRFILFLAMLAAAGMVFCFCSPRDSGRAAGTLADRLPVSLAVDPEVHGWHTGKVFRWERYDGNPGLLIEEAEEAGLNMISVMDRYFTRGDETNSRLVELAGERGILVFIIFQTFYNDDATIDELNSARDKHGNMVRDSWLTFICPNEEGYKMQRLQDIEELVRRVEPHGISMDFFRYFVYWEAGRDGDRIQTCFCSRCMEGFKDQYGITASPDHILSWHPDEWTQFKCNTITNYAALIHESVNRIKPGILMNLHMVPWKQDDYDGAITRIAAQDIGALSRYFDFFQPMTYSTMVDEPVEWIYEVGVDVYRNTTGSYVIPCIQAADATPGNIEAVVRPPVHGYSIWPFERYLELAGQAQQ